MMSKVGRFLRGTGIFLVYVFLYLWSGAAYKLVYNLGHEKSATTQVRGGLETFQELRSYQILFRLDSWTRLTYLFGSDFGRYIGGPNPSLFSGRKAITAWLERRADELIALADERGDSLWSDNALRDALLFGAMAGRSRSEEDREYHRVVWFCTGATTWRWASRPDLEPQSREATERLINNYPESPFVPQAMAGLLEQYRQAYDFAQVNEIAHQLVQEYPTSRVALDLAMMLANLHAGRGEYALAADLLRPVLDGAEEPHLPPQKQLQLQSRRLSLASYYRQSGRLRQARKQYEHAARMLGEAVTQGWGEEGLAPEESLPEDRWTQELESFRQGLEAGLQEVWVAEMFAALQVEDTPAPEPEKKKSYPVRGQVLCEGKPLAGCRIGLPVHGGGRKGPLNLRRLPLIGAQNADYFTTTDRQGRFSLPEIPPGQYGLILVVDLKILPPEAVLVETPAPVVVRDQPVVLNPVRFAPRIVPLSPERQTVAEEGSLTLRWKPYAGAARYQIWVSPDHFQDERSPRLWRRRGKGFPSPDSIPEKCWQLKVGAEDTQIQVPLAGLRQGVPPQPRWIPEPPPEAYFWLVGAFDERGRLLSTSERYEEGQWPKVTVQPMEEEGSGAQPRGGE